MAEAPQDFQRQRVRGARDLGLGDNRKSRGSKDDVTTHFSFFKIFRNICVISDSLILRYIDFSATVLFTVAVP